MKNNLTDMKITLRTEIEDVIKDYNGQDMTENEKVLLEAIMETIEEYFNQNVFS